MSNFFEQELRKLFGDGSIIESPQFVGRACLGTLGGDLRVRAQFVTGIIANQYNALKIVVLNRTDGPVDTMVLKLRDLLGTKVAPYIWDDSGKAQWYGCRPTIANYEAIRQAADDSLSVFRAEIHRERPPASKSKTPRSRRGQER